MKAIDQIAVAGTIQYYTRFQFCKMKQFSVSIPPSPLNSHPMHFISMVERDLSKLLSDQKLIDFFLNDSRTRDGLLEAKHILSITPQLEKYFPCIE